MAVHCIHENRKFLAQETYHLVGGGYMHCQFCKSYHIDGFTRTYVIYSIICVSREKTTERPCLHTLPVSMDQKLQNLRPIMAMS